MRALAPLLLLLPGGCIASTAVAIITAPVKLASGAVDMATTSQSEADEKRGREIRRREQRMGELERDERRFAAKCADGNSKACRQRDEAAAEREALLPTIPYEPERS